jgi:hypothetical protein
LKVTIYDAAGNPLGSDVVLHFTLDTAPPAVECVLVKGSGWSASFLECLESSGVGHHFHGYAIPVGSPDQLRQFDSRYGFDSRSNGTDRRDRRFVHRVGTICRQL